MNKTLPFWIAGILCLTAYASDWPRWRGPNNDGIVPAGQPIPKTLPPNMKPVWHIPIGAGLGSPVVSDGTVFYLDNQNGMETVHAVRASDAKELWRAPLDIVHRDYQSKPGPRDTPVVDGSRVYAQSCRGKLHCIDASNGKTLWKVDYVKDFHAVYIGERGSAMGASRHGYCAPPLVDGDQLYVAVGGTNDASVVCFEKGTGHVIWKSQNDIAAFAAPTVANIDGVKQVVAFTTLGVMGLNARNGKLLWRVRVKTSLGRHIVTPIIRGNLVVVSSFQAGMLAYRIRHAGDAFHTELAWRSRPAAVNMVCPVAVDGYLYAVNLRQKLECVQMTTGKMQWAQPNFTGQRLHRDGAGLIGMGRRVLVLTDNGFLTLFSADPSVYHLIAQQKICGDNWCNPAYADGKLYLRDDQELMCYALQP